MPSVARAVPSFAYGGIAAAGLIVAGCTYSAGRPPQSAVRATYDVVIKGGTIYDGSGGKPYVGDVAIEGDRIVAVGGNARGEREIDAKGLAVAPGFINMLSWANESLIEDGRGLSDIMQGVTLEVMGEGWSMGPLNPEMKRLNTERQGDIKYKIEWTTLGEYLEHLQKRGISPNVASFVGAITVRTHELGERDVDPTPEQLGRMRALVRGAMEEGAVGVGTSMIYPPGAYAETPELIALASEAGKCGGMYISHMRSEADRLVESVKEVIEIGAASGAPAEIYHLKAAGRDNWGKLDEAVRLVEKARAQGQRVSANMYLYTAGATELGAAMPPWVLDGGREAMLMRLRDPASRARIRGEMTARGDWENLYLQAGGGAGILVINIVDGRLKPLIGRTVAEIAADQKKAPEDVIMDLVLEDKGRTGAVFFLMSEANVRRAVSLPWVSFGSDGEAAAPEGLFLRSSAHPRAYGNFARLLGRYVRDEKVLTLSEAVRRLTSMPAENLGLDNRGRLVQGHYADLVVFDPATIKDNATFEKPMQLASGVRDVFVNGVPVVEGGKPTANRPGRAVRGRAWLGWGRGGCAGTK